MRSNLRRHMRSCESMRLRRNLASATTCSPSGLPSPALSTSTSSPPTSSFLLPPYIPTGISFVPPSFTSSDNPFHPPSEIGWQQSQSQEAIGSSHNASPTMLAMLSSDLSYQHQDKNPVNCTTVLRDGLEALLTGKTCLEDLREHDFASPQYTFPVGSWTCPPPPASRTPHHDIGSHTYNDYAMHYS